ncbi:MAG: phosphoribosylglycinamide formyltransferase [Oscillospiraceae bacterium]|nr:phosphoribosylglycinamide formyltransferase [Oscillospiraceae bacterium]
MINIVVLVSGGGTNLQAILDAQAKGEIRGGSVTFVISSSPDAYALVRAQKNNIGTAVINPKDFDSRAQFDAAVSKALADADAGLVVYAGFNYILGTAVTDKYPKRMINVHPSLIPAFCGEGFFGLRVHKAALNYGVKITGATVFYVNEICDGGEIIMQKAVPVLDGDTPEILQKRVMEQAEHEILPKAINLVVSEIERRG